MERCDREPKISRARVARSCASHATKRRRLGRTRRTHIISIGLHEPLRCPLKNWRTLRDTCVQLNVVVVDMKRLRARTFRCFARRHRDKDGCACVEQKLNTIHSFRCTTCRKIAPSFSSDIFTIFIDCEKLCNRRLAASYDDCSLVRDQDRLARQCVCR
jgi:hypothetical protein